MKVAISTDSGHVSAHFGRCPEFTICTIEDGKVVRKEIIANPGHQPGFLPQFFGDQGVHVVIAGGAGQRAQSLFTEKNIQLILGAVGTIDQVLNELCQGTLVGGESLCQPGVGKGYGVEKDECDHGGDHHHH
ncbi:MAG: NifB/NifX family molybdenum-iron cluster-binding protein [Candidatus Zhuqueibacterota bacterium]